MPTQQKIDLVQDIKDRLERSSIVMTTNYAGISVNQMIELRRAMRSGGVEFTIAKNTLLALAADEAKKQHLKDLLNIKKKMQDRRLVQVHQGGQVRDALDALPGALEDVRHAHCGHLVRGLLPAGLPLSSTRESNKRPRAIQRHPRRLPQYER